MGTSAGESGRVRPLTDDATIRWLLDGDPSIRWQTMRDLCGASERVVERERRHVATTGWGARLLGHQKPSGHWGRGAYQPKWTCTTYTMQLLGQLGLPARHPQALRGCRALLDDGFYRDCGINFSTKGKHSETCITGMVLACTACFHCDDDRVEHVVEHLLARQMPDGGWNCRAIHGATHASMHTTISVLEGLREYELAGGKGTRTAQVRGREFLLRHRLFRSHRTGRMINDAWMRFAFPPRWHYDILRALDYFRASNAPRDERLSEAIEIVREHRNDGGRWVLENEYHGRTHFRLESRGKPSRWNTLRALRVLRWWERVQH